MDNDMNYSGPDRDYKPESGHGSIPNTSSTRVLPSSGYHDLDMLRRLLAELQRITDQSISAAENHLNNYSLKVDPGSKLADAQTAEWPDELGESKDYITYSEYKYLGTKGSRGSSYIRKMYEDHLRGPSGSIALDVLDLSDIIRQESVQITNFLNTYLGDVNDTSEYRALELFQDWAHNALVHAKSLGSIVTEESKAPPQIPSSELGKISSKQAAEYQLLFRAKMNALNNDLLRTKEHFHKEFSELTPIYHNKFLGPALDFRLKATRGLEGLASDRTFLGSQAQEAIQPLNASLEVMLADQMERNQLFYDKMAVAVDRVEKRDRFGSYIKQLEHKGKKVKNPFTKVQPSEAEISYFQKNTVTPTTITGNKFQSSHALLDGVEEPDAHPQYLKSRGDTLRGEFWFDLEEGSTEARGPEGEPLPFDGMRPGGRYGHRHLGEDRDGTRQLSAVESLEAGTLAAALVDVEEQVIVPDRLRFIGQSSNNRLGLADLQFAWDDSGERIVNQYEVQIVRVPYQDDAGSVCLIGHSDTYSTDNIDSESKRRYIRNGLETGHYPGKQPIIPDGDPYYYQVTTVDNDVLMDRAFITAYDGNLGKDVRVTVSTRVNVVTNRWDQAGSELKAASMTSGTQGHIAISSALPSLALLGCKDSVDEDDTLVIKLIQAQYSYSSSPPVSALSVLHTNPLISDTTGITDMHGVYGIEVGFYNTFLTAYSFVESGTIKLYVNSGKIAASRGSDTYDITRITETNAEIISSGLEIKDVQIKALAPSKYLVLYGTDNGSGSFNWYIRIVSLNIQTTDIIEVGDATLVASGATTKGVPSISIINSSNFFLVWAEST
jgi:hypothetical protein